MLNRFHPVYHSYTCLAGSRIDVERVLEADLDMDDPEDVIDQFSEPPQFFERLSPVSTQIDDTTVKGRNWTDMMIKCYRIFGKIFMRSTMFLKQSLANDYNEDFMVPFMSMCVDPDTLARLIEYDYEAGETSCNKLVSLYEEGAVTPAITTPFHSILPLLRSNLDRRLCIRWGFTFSQPLIKAYQRYLKQINETRMTISFWVPEACLNLETIKIIHEEFLAFCQKEKFKKPHLVLLADADMACEKSLDKIMKSWCRPNINGKAPKDITIIFRDSTFSDWMMTSHPSIKKIIDRTIAKVDANLTEQDIDYSWAHFESLEALTYSPRDAVHFEQRFLKLCELGYLPVSPDTYVLRKLNGRFGTTANEPMTVDLENPQPADDLIGEKNHYGRWRGWALNEEKKPAVMPSIPFARKRPKGTDKRQGSPAWKIAWEKTRDICFDILGGNPDKFDDGMLGVLAGLSGCTKENQTRENVENFLVEYALVYWREHFIQHDKSEADIRIDEIVNHTLRKGVKAKASLTEVISAGTAAQAYFFLHDSCNSFALNTENIDQRAMFQNTVMLTLALCNGIAVYHYLNDEKKAKQLVDTIMTYLVDFGSAYERFDLDQYGVSQEAWNAAMESEISESKRNVVERAAMRTAARHLEEFGYEDRFESAAAEMTTNVGHNWSTEMSAPNYKWANPYFCGVHEA